MVTIEMRLKAERRMRQLLVEDGIQQPDIVQYGDSCIRFFWDGANHSVIVEIEDDGTIGESRLGAPPPGGKTSQPPV